MHAFSHFWVRWWFWSIPTSQLTLSCQLRLAESPLPNIWALTNQAIVTITLKSRSHEQPYNKIQIKKIGHKELTHCSLVAPYGLINISLGNGLLPEGNKPLPKPMLTGYLVSIRLFVFTSGKFYRLCKDINQLCKSIQLPKTTMKSLLLEVPNPKTEMFLIASCSCYCPIHWSQVLSREWRCSWSSADRRCSNHIWVITNLIAY